MVTSEPRGPTLRPYFGLAGVAVIFALTLLAMEYVNRLGRREYFNVTGAAALPIAVLSAFALAIWSLFSVERSGLSARMWLCLWVASGLGAFVGGFASLEVSWAVHLQGPSLLIVIAVLVVGVRRTAQVVGWSG